MEDGWFISEDFIGGSETSITEEKFAEIECAHFEMMSLWNIETNFDVLAKSFVELEKYLLNTSANYEFSFDHNQDANVFFGEAVNMMNVRMLTFLTASRVFNDSAHKNIKRIFKGNDSLYRSTFSKSYDEYFEYRIMDQLRNYAIHHDLPIDNLSLSGSWERGDNLVAPHTTSRRRATIDPRFICEKILEWGKLKANVRREIEGLSAQHLDAKFLTRVFMSTLADCLKEIRENTVDIFNSNMEKFQTCKKLLDAESIEGNSSHIRAFYREEGNVVKSIHIDPENFKRLKSRRKTWQRMTNMKYAYISSEVIREKGTYPFDPEDLLIK